MAFESKELDEYISRQKLIEVIPVIYSFLGNSPASEF